MKDEPRALIFWLIAAGVVVTNAAARRLCMQKAVKVNGVVITCINTIIPLGATIKVGKRKTLKVPMNGINILTLPE